MTQTDNKTPYRTVDDFQPHKKHLEAKLKQIDGQTEKPTKSVPKFLSADNVVRCPNCHLEFDWTQVPERTVHEKKQDEALDELMGTGGAE